MKKTFLLSAIFCAGAALASAQNIQDDPIIMDIAGVPVHRSEFEYSYNKNNSEGVIDKKTVEEYVELFVNYKLKVRAALDEHMDTLTSFKKEYLEYRDQQVRPTLITDADIDAEAKKIYDNTRERVGDELVAPAHILIRLLQSDDMDAQNKAKVRADSIYNALMNGADFTELAKTLSDDKASAVQGGSIGWIGKGQTIKEFEDAAFSMKEGEISKPVLSTFGYHIIKMTGRKPFDSFETLRSDIIRFIDARGIREAIINNRLESLIAEKGATDKQEILNMRADSLAAIDSDMENLFREYYDGLLLYEISNREVWDKGAKDEEGLTKFFKKNKKNYTWDTPHFKGIAYHCKDEADVAAVKACLKGKKFDKWADILRTTFNSDSVLRIRAEKGIFNKGDNSLVDKEVYGEDKTPAPLKGYPFDGTYGTLLKAPKEMNDVRGQVTADYQDMLEKVWVSELRKKYTVIVNENIVATVNKH